MKTWMIILLFFMCNVFTLFIITVIPYITRKTESFGVGIPEEVHGSPEVKNLRRIYRDRTLAWGGALSLAALLLALVKASDITYLAIPASVILLIPLHFIFYWSGHQRMKALKEENRWMAGKTQMVVVDTGFRSRKNMASPLWFLLYAVVILATALTGFLLYDKIPDKMPMHWNINGEVDRWGTKSFKTVLWAPVVQIFLGLVMAFSYWMISKSKQMIDASNPEKSAEQNRVFRYRWSVFTIVTGLALVVLFGVMQMFTYGFFENTWVLMALPIVAALGIVIASVVLSLKTGQGGSKVYLKEVKNGNTTESKVVSRDEDKYWKLGLFYYNPDDPSFIVEKRFGIGWTNNWARPISWIIIAGLILAIVGFSIITAIMAQ